MTNEELLKKRRDDHEATGRIVAGFRSALGKLIGGGEAGDAPADASQIKDDLTFTLYVGFNYLGEHLTHHLGVEATREIFEGVASRAEESGVFR